MIRMLMPCAILMLLIRFHGLSAQNAIEVSADGTVLIGNNTTVIKIPPSGKIEVKGDITTTGKLCENGNPLLPRGTVIMWYGAEKDIPLGWVQCNGSNGTPDLRSKFVIGVGNSYPVNQSGGKDAAILEIKHLPKHDHSINHGHTITDPGHSHNVGTNEKAGDMRGAQYVTKSAWNDYVQKSTTGISINYLTQNSGETGGGQEFSILPPYYALFYIMKQ